MSKLEYPVLTKVFLKRLGIQKCHPEMIVSNKLSDKYIVLCAYCMRRDYIPKQPSNLIGEKL